MYYPEQYLYINSMQDASLIAAVDRLDKSAVAAAIRAGANPQVGIAQARSHMRNSPHRGYINIIDYINRLSTTTPNASQYGVPTTRRSGLFNRLFRR